MDSARANDLDDLFSTETAGLAQVAPPASSASRTATASPAHRPVHKRLEDAELRMLAYNGSISGPTLHVRQGSGIAVQVTNDGDIEATVH